MLPQKPPSKTSHSGLTPYSWHMAPRCSSRAGSLISATARCREPSLREAMRTLAPASTKPWAMAWPIPPAPPTATTFLPFGLNRSIEIPPQIPFSFGLFIPI